MRVHLFDKAWKKILTTSFPTGYRLFLEDALLEDGTGIGMPLLMIRVTSAGPFIELPSGGRKPAFEQGEFERQFYAFTGGRFALVRLEDDRKQITSNGYTSRHPWKGAKVPERSVEAWIKSLASGEVAEKLATMVWLSGRHKKSGETRQENVSQETVEDSKRYEEVCASPRTKEALEKLKAHQSEWVRDYAVFTLRRLVAKDQEE